MSDSSSPASDLDLRLVRYFVAVAEHRHFSRAAAELRVAQPSLSRQVRSLEQQLGARLLDRTPHGTQLTEAGEVFLPRAKALLRSAAQAAAATNAAPQPDHHRLHLGPGHHPGRARAAQSASRRRGARTAPALERAARGPARTP